MCNSIAVAEHATTTLVSVYIVPPMVQLTLALGVPKSTRHPLSPALSTRPAGSRHAERRHRVAQ